MALDVQHPVTYDGNSLNTDVSGEENLVFWLAHGLDETGEVRGEDTVIPGATGRIPRNRVFDHRLIEIEGYIAGVGATEALQRTNVRTLLESFRTWFSPTRTPANLVVGLDNGGTATISCRPLNVAMPDPEDQPDPTVIRVSIEFIAVSDWVIA